MRYLLMIVMFCFAQSVVFGQTEAKRLTITPLKHNFYVFTTYMSYKGNRTPANGMYVVTRKGAILIDTPWDTTQFQPLLDSIWIKHHKKVRMCIATHFHNDRTGGLAFLRSKGVKTYTTLQTDKLCQKHGEKRASYIMCKDTVFKVGGYSFQVYYPGPGHAPDNIVVWFEKDKVLYGGCLVKSLEAKDLGNLADADVAAWTNSIRNVQQRCKDPLYIIPGHQGWSNNRSLEHTLRLIRQQTRENDH